MISSLLEVKVGLLATYFDASDVYRTVTEH